MRSHRYFGAVVVLGACAHPAMDDDAADMAPTASVALSS